MPLEQTWVQLESPAIVQGQMSFSYELHFQEFKDRGR